MKTSNTVIWFSILAALFMATYAGLGLFSTSGPGTFTFTSLRGQSVDIFGRGIYRFDTTFFSAGFRGNDAVTLLLELPLMIAAILLYRRGSIHGAFLLAGSLAYVLYNSFSLGTGAAYNPLFLFYIASFFLSLFAFGMLWAHVDFPGVQKRNLPGMPRRDAAIFLFIGGSVTALLWLSDILPPLMQGNPPALLGPYTTAITYFVDLSVITPLCILAGVWLMRKDVRGSLAGFVLLYLLALMGFIVIGQTIFQVKAGILFSTGQFIGMIGSWVIMGSIAIGFVLKILRHLVEK